MENQITRSNITGYQQNFTNPHQENFGSSKPISQVMHGPHSRRSGSSKPKKKERNQPIKIIKNINNNNYIFNNP